MRSHPSCESALGRLAASLAPYPDSCRDWGMVADAAASPFGQHFVPAFSLRSNVARFLPSGPRPFRTTLPHLFHSLLHLRKPAVFSLRRGRDRYFPRPMSVRPVVFAAWITLLVGFTGCSSAPLRPLSERERRARTERVWLVSNRFHTSIAVRAKDAPLAIRAQHPHAAYFVIGWGGKNLYMLRHVRPWEWVTTILFPTSSALHVIPIHTSLAKEAPNSDIIEFKTTRRGRNRLLTRLRRSFARDGKGKPQVAGEGKLPTSRFYEGSETYYLPKTCNLWAAASLKIAGVPIYLCPAIMADNLLRQGWKHGRILSVYRAPGDKL
jgi:uncharacterized protein (TIGR02117 family)